jgi:hypothetical protein
LSWRRSLPSCFLANRPISAVTISIWRSLWRSAFRTYQGASVSVYFVLKSLYYGDVARFRASP